LLTMIGCWLKALRTNRETLASPRKRNDSMSYQRSARCSKVVGVSTPAGFLWASDCERKS
jgi:hypothetical protein